MSLEISLKITVKGRCLVWSDGVVTVEQEIDSRIQKIIAEFLQERTSGVQAARKFVLAEVLSAGDGSDLAAFKRQLDPDVN